MCSTVDCFTQAIDNEIWYGNANVKCTVIEELPCFHNRKGYMKYEKFQTALYTATSFEVFRRSYQLSSSCMNSKKTTSIKIYLVVTVIYAGDVPFKRTPKYAFYVFFHSVHTSIGKYKW